MVFLNWLVQSYDAEVEGLVERWSERILILEEEGHRQGSRKYQIELAKYQLWTEKADEFKRQLDRDRASLKRKIKILSLE